MESCNVRVSYQSCHVIYSFTLSISKQFAVTLSLGFTIHDKEPELV